jgi:electron transfer flavoprotein alpha subunit
MTEMLIYSDKPDAANELVFQGKRFADSLGLGVCAAALGPDAESAAAGLAAYGADRVYISGDAALEGLQPDVVADALTQIAALAGASHLLVSSTRRDKELTGRLSQRLGAGAITDVTTMTVEDGQLVAGCYALGGNTLATERIDTAIKVFAVMPKSFEVGEPQAGAGEVIRPSLSLSPSTVKVVNHRARESESVHLDAAPRIVGLSGAKTKPDFYLALGISGQIQHTVGISQAKVIAAINTDKEAPIFQLADYGIVGDIYEVVLALVKKLKGQ